MTTATNGWSFVTLVSDADKQKAAPAETGGDATTKFMAKKGWRGWSYGRWALIAVVALVVLVLIIVLPIALSGSSSDSGTITLGHAKACDVNVELLTVAGSKTGRSTADLVYTKDADSNGECDLTPCTNCTGWTAYTADASSTVEYGTNVPASIGKVNADGYLTVTYNSRDCPVYQYDGNTGVTTPLGVSAAWPVLWLDPQTNYTLTTSTSSLSCP